MIAKRKTITESSYPYSKAEFNPETFEEDHILELFDLLPHGSGIDYTWNITQQKQKNNVFYVSNAYHAMDECGGYCHTYDFTFTIQYNGKDKFIPCQYCNGKGKRFVRDMMKYHPNMTEFQLSDWLLDNHRVDWIMDDNNKGNYFPCNVCHMEGKINLPAWDIIRLNFHGQKEHNCCGYDLKDYLYQTIELSLHP